MDKLKPILAQKFWILLFVAFGLSIYGYIASAGPMREAAQAEIDKIEQAKSSVKSAAGQANEDYAVKLTARVEELQNKNKQVVEGVWVDQLASMTWPVKVAARMKSGYRSEITDSVARRQYHYDYEDQVEELFKILEPIVGETYKDKPVDWPQKLFVDQKTIPTQRIQRETNRRITGEKMWDAQEDLWYMRVLFEAIRDANADAQNIADSTVRRIDTIRLFGGDGAAVLEGAEPAAGGGAGDPGAGYAESYASDYGGGDFGGAGSASAVKVDFDPAEEFGSAGGVGGGGYDYASSGPPGEGGTAAEPPKRYIAFEEGSLFRERGFYLSVIVDQNQIPEFLASLSSARWPIRVGRFQIGPNPYYKEDVKSVSSASSPYGGGGNGGGYGGGYGGGSQYDSGGGYGPPGSEYAAEAASDYGGSPYDSGGGYGPSGGDFGVTDGASVSNDAAVVAALSSPDLVRMTVTGAITMYSPPEADVLPLERQPVPVEGQPYALLPDGDAVVDPPVESEEEAIEDGSDEAMQDGDAVGPTSESPAPEDSASPTPDASPDDGAAESPLATENTTGPA